MRAGRQRIFNEQPNQTVACADDGRHNRRAGRHRADGIAAFRTTSYLRLCFGRRTSVVPRGRGGGRPAAAVLRAALVRRCRGRRLVAAEAVRQTAGRYQGFVGQTAGGVAVCRHRRPCAVANRNRRTGFAVGAGSGAARNDGGVRLVVGQAARFGRGRRAAADCLRFRRGLGGGIQCAAGRHAVYSGNDARRVDAAGGNGGAVLFGAGNRSVQNGAGRHAAIQRRLAD